MTVRLVSGNVPAIFRVLTGEGLNPVRVDAPPTRMSLIELIGGVADHEKTLTVFNADPGVAADLREYFADRNVAVREEATESGKPDEFVVLTDDDGEVLTATGLAELRHLLDDSATLGPGDRPYRTLVDYLDETLFTSWDTEQMVAASREIEDRAWRVGSGRLFAGFQYLSTLRGELPVYERLGEKPIEVHAYAAPDEDPPDYDGFTLHIERSEEIRRSWFVVYDGDGDDDQKCALLAEERAPRSFYGFWTYDPGTVNWIVDYLESTYGTVESR